MGDHVNSDPNMSDEERMREKWGAGEGHAADTSPRRSSPPDPAVSPAVQLERPAGNASAEEWRAYVAATTGAAPGSLEGKTRAELVELADQQARQRR